MSFALICILSIVALGVVAAIASFFQKGDDEIVVGHDCSTCTSHDDGSCKIACLMDEKKKKDAARSCPSCVVILVVSSLLLAGCSTQKNTARSRFWHSFSAKYNTYFNGSQAFIDGNLEKEQGNKDNYTELLPLYPVGNKQSRELGRGNYDRTIEKMEKAIKQHSIKAKPEWNKSRRKTDKDREWLSRREYNPFIWKAWLMLGQAQFQKGAFDEAAATFNYMSRLYQTQPAINGIARAWLAKCYTELNWTYDAEDVIRNMQRDEAGEVNDTALRGAIASARDVWRRARTRREQEAALEALSAAVGPGTAWKPLHPNALAENFEVLVVAIAVAMAFRCYFLEPFKIPTGSMQPTLYGIYSSDQAVPELWDRMPLKLVK